MVTGINFTSIFIYGMGISNRKCQQNNKSNLNTPESGNIYFFLFFFFLPMALNGATQYIFDWVRTVYNSYSYILQTSCRTKLYFGFALFYLCNICKLN